ncbi:hypothetical protein BC829DRAFT_397709 [Chytridium lagenaria]|nr:hypothetical protein BC829DRAFT_397709 [Chytridium lagenaria]
MEPPRPPPKDGIVMTGFTLMHSPRVVLELAESQLFLKDIPSANASLIPFAEHLISRIESLSRHTRAISNDIPSATSVLVTVVDHYLLRRDLEITRGSFQDADHILSLRSRVSITAKLLTDIYNRQRNPDTWDDQRQAGSPSHMAEKTAEARIKELSDTARSCYVHVVKKGCGVPWGGLQKLVKDLAASLPSGAIGAARAINAPDVKRWMVDVCTDLQIKVLDAIEGQDLRLRRRQANRNVDAIIHILDEQRDMLLHVERELKRLSEL